MLPCYCVTCNYVTILFDIVLFVNMFTVLLAIVILASCYSATVLLYYLLLRFYVSVRCYLLLCHCDTVLHTFYLVTIFLYYLFKSVNIYQFLKSQLHFFILVRRAGDTVA